MIAMAQTRIISSKPRHAKASRGVVVCTLKIRPLGGVADFLYTFLCGVCMIGDIIFTESN